MEGSNRPGLVPDTIGMVSTQIEVDDLDVLSERGEIRLEVRVVPDSGAAVDQHDRRPLPHLVAIGHERWSIHVEPESRSHSPRCTSRSHPSRRGSPQSMM
jgi:hypothetical protein